MATKTAAKKTTTKRKAPVKSTKKAKTTTRVARVSKAKAPVLQSFRVSPNTRPFFTFKITKQTVYWILLLLVIVALQLWIIKLQLDVATLSDSLLLAE